MMTQLMGMMMIAVIMMVVFGSQFVSSITYTSIKDKEIHEDQRLQSVELPSISNQLTLPHVPPEISSSEVNTNTVEALSSTIPDYEMQALKDLYDSTDGDNWRWTDGDVHWDFTIDNVNPCEWTGLDCSYDRSSRIYHVTSIYLINFNLYGTLPASLGQLAKLTALGLYNGNSLTGTIPVSMGNLSELIWLNLDGNELIGSIPAFLGQLLKLSVMAFSSNVLTGTLPASLGQLSQLTVLWLTGNLLTGTLPESLGQLSKITILGLDNNQLSGSIPDSLGQLSEVYGLSLDDNLLTGSLPASFGQLSELYGLSLNNNFLTGTLPASLGQLSKLTSLYMSDNSFTGTLPASMENLSKLSSLYLDNNQLIGTIPSSLCKCQEMNFRLNNNMFLVIQHAWHQVVIKSKLMKISPYVMVLLMKIFV
jgi:Leucine-rich repeat (LRR) protein